MEVNAEMVQPVDGFMRAMAAKDTETARTYLTEPYGRTLTKARLDRQIAGLEYAKYEEYERAMILSFSTSSGTEGSSAEIGGTITYRNGNSTPFQADLVQDGGVWKIDRLDVETP
jgi:hypothetical protein